MATCEVRALVDQAGAEPRGVNGVRVDLYPASTLETELGGAPELGDAPSSTAIATNGTAYTGGERGFNGVALFTGVTAGRYWAKISWANTTYWQWVYAGA